MPNLPMKFGFFPGSLDFTAGNITVRSLPDAEENRKRLLANNGVRGDWIYAPPAAVTDIVSGQRQELPHSSRVFGLPQTHEITHAQSVDPPHVGFLVWTLGFIYGIRLTETEAGFLDATPVKPGVLHDIGWVGRSEQRALALADDFWQRHAANPKVCKGITGVIHAFFLSQTPTQLDFERFIYLYTSLDGCYRVWELIHGPIPKNQKPTHARRIEFLCTKLGIPVPPWADSSSGTVAAHRNNTLHEALFFDEPLGFSTFGGSSAGRPTTGDHLLEMNGLVSRVLCALLGFNDPGYIQSPLNTRQIIPARL
jgi:hypothetical protein